MARLNLDFDNLELMEIIHLLKLLTLNSVIDTSYEINYQIALDLRTFYFD